MPETKMKSVSLEQIIKQIRTIDESSEDWPALALGLTVPLSSHIINTRSRFLWWKASASAWETYSPYETIMQENAELRLENRRLASMAVNLEKRINVLERKLSEENIEENVIVLRQINKDEAKAEISNLFMKGGTLYYSDIAKELQLDLEMVVDICNELMSEGKISVPDNP